MKSLILKITLALGVMIACFAAGYLSNTPAEITKETTNTTENKTTNTKGDVVKVITKKPDGTTEIVILDKTQKKTEETKTKTTTSEKTVSKSKYAVGAWVETSPFDLKEKTYRGDVSMRLFGDIWGGISINSRKELGVGLRYEF